MLRGRSRGPCAFPPKSLLQVSVRHLDQRTALARVTVLAKTDIKAGQELIVTYVNPELHLKARRAALEAWGFGECRCERCAEEEIKFGKRMI